MPFSGEAVAIVGANGSGKSTALRCALRLIEPSAGDVVLDGRSIIGLSGKRLRTARARVGFVFQRHNLSTRLTVLSNVLHGALARGGGMRNWSHAFARPEERARAPCTAWIRSASPIWPDAARTACPAASRSASPSPAP